MDTHDARRQDVSLVPPPDRDWQWLWLSAWQHSWRSIALIPSDPRIRVRSIAEACVAGGQSHTPGPVRVLDAEGSRLADVQQLLGTMQTMIERGEWLIVPVDPIAENPAAIAIARATSAAVVVVRLGESTLDSARRVVEAVGRAHVLGSIVIDDQ